MSTIYRQDHSKLGRCRKDNAIRVRLAWFIGVLCLWFVVPNPASGGYWRVEQDGSGDFIDIQSGVDAAAPGDTIFIGPGNYTELHEIQIPAWGLPTQVVAMIETEGLVFIGAGRDQVFIGPEEYDPDNFDLMTGPMGFLAGYISDSWRVEGVSFRNMYNGIYNYGELSLSDCGFQWLEGAGIALFSVSGLNVDNCSFEEGHGSGVEVHGCTGTVSISDSVHRGVRTYLQNCNDVVMVNCGSYGGSSEGNNGVFLVSSSGDVTDFHGEDFPGSGIQIIGNSYVRIRNSYIQANWGAIVLSNDGFADVDSSVLRGGVKHIIKLFDRGQISIAMSHLDRGSGSYVDAQGYSGPPAEMDFTNNFWGTTDLDTIAEHIWDGIDDPRFRAIINYEPISDVPLAAEEKSLGSFKAMFR